MNHPARIYQKNSDIVARKIVDEMILVPVRRRVGDVESLYTRRLGEDLCTAIYSRLNGDLKPSEFRLASPASGRSPGVQAFLDQ